MRYSHLIRAIDSASQQLRARAVTTVNQFLVLRNWLIGAYIVEFEQLGEDRAKYGARLMDRLAMSLAKRGLKGLGASSLKNCRQVYLLYPQIRQPLVGELTRLSVPESIRQPVVGELPGENPSMSRSEAINQIPSSRIPSPKVLGLRNIKPLSAEAVLRFSWSQLTELIRLDDPLKRAFYENECLKGIWSKRQLQRQIGSLLYERTALSNNKHTVVRRAQRQERQEQSRI